MRRKGGMGAAKRENKRKGWGRQRGRIRGRDGGGKKGER